MGWIITQGTVALDARASWVAMLLKSMGRILTLGKESSTFALHFGLSFHGTFRRDNLSALLFSSRLTHLALTVMLYLSVIFCSSLSVLTSSIFGPPNLLQFDTAAELSSTASTIEPANLRRWRSITALSPSNSLAVLDLFINFISLFNSCGFRAR